MFQNLLSIWGTFSGVFAWGHLSYHPFVSKIIRFVSTLCVSLLGYLVQGFFSFFPCSACSLVSVICGFSYSLLPSSGCRSVSSGSDSDGIVFCSYHCLVFFWRSTSRCFFHHFCFRLISSVACIFLTCSCASAIFVRLVIRFVFACSPYFAFSLHLTRSLSLVAVSV